MTAVRVLSGGAAQGLVGRLEARFREEAGARLHATFGAVGAMKERLLAGQPCDVLILTQALIAELAAGGHAVGASARPLGIVKTGIAVKTGRRAPRVDSPEALKDALLAAKAIHFPDPVKATAGIHFMKVLDALGIADTVASRLRPFPNGAAAMKAMADADGDDLVGCTQVTEILGTPGVELVAPLPKSLGLETVYTAAVATRAQSIAAGEALVRLLSDDSTADIRRAAGFEDRGNPST
jgi:molybdate transport system substrate-binding protein